MKETRAPEIADASTHRRAIARHIEQLSHSRSTWNVFSDFLELSAISISNAVDPAQRTSREQRYQAIATQYTPEEMKAFSEMFAELVLALECGFSDVLGQLFHDLELHNKYAGQFFTPYSLCQSMAQMTLGDRAAIEERVAERGYLTLLEPAAGGGAMVIAAAEALKDAGVNYQHALHATAVDIDLKCVHMAYLQLSLLHVPAVVVHGNSLTLEEHSRWYTPAHILAGWSWKLRRAAQANVAPEVITSEATVPAQIATRDAQLSLLDQVA